MGPYLVTAESVTEPSNLDFELTVNGEPRQKANTRDLIIGIADLIVFASAYYTLMPGDLLMTGTPDGVGPIKPGDVIDARIDQLGAMQVKVR
jgi:2-keto-4-pentenoate hydratase/2-oxohepta-3-ene-1,7-dioic acid hydratase in catechol pathway